MSLISHLYQREVNGIDLIFSLLTSLSHSVLLFYSSQFFLNTSLAVTLT